MKKLIGISLLSVTFLAVSCQKEVISVNETKTAEAPIWRSVATSPDAGTSTGSAAGNGTGITDPNNDPDMNSKKVVKN